MKRRADARAVGSHSTSLSVAEQFGHRLLMGNRPRAALGDPLLVFPEGGRGDGGLVWVTGANGLGPVSSHGTKCIACNRHCPGTAPKRRASTNRWPRGPLALTDIPDPGRGADRVQGVGQS